MPAPQSLVLRFVLAAGLGVLADPGTDLRVLRVVPSGDASPTTAVTVTFDRPVAGSLDRTVDPGRIFTIAPAVAGAVDWRDPVTLRFRPAAPLAPNTSYTVTVANSFAAMDGSRLQRAVRLQLPGPRPPRARRLADRPQRRHGLPRAGRPLRPGGRRAGRSRRGRGGRVRRVQPALPPAGRGPARGRERSAPSRLDDRWDFREAGGWDRDRSADRLRRVVRLAPRTPLPHGCAGELVVPTAFDERAGGRAAPLGPRHLRRLPAGARELRLGGPRLLSHGPTRAALHHAGARRGRAAPRRAPAGRAVRRSATPATSAPSGSWTRRCSRAPPTPSWPIARCATGSTSRSPAIRSRRSAPPGTRRRSTTRRGAPSSSGRAPAPSRSPSSTSTRSRW